MILLDTNVISELIKPSPDANVTRWYLVNASQCWISSITIAESAYGIAKLDPGKKRAMLMTQLTDWRIAHANRTHIFSASTAMIYGEIMANARRNGHNMAVPDAQIAAIAEEHDLVLATRNRRDFLTTTLKLADPWSLIQ